VIQYLELINLFVTAAGLLNALEQNTIKQWVMHFQMPPDITMFNRALSFDKAQNSHGVFFACHK
jgi:hypothetical protein